MAKTKKKTKKKAKIQEWTPESLRAAINKEFGNGTVLRGSDPSLEIKRLSTGILAIDMLTGGGFPFGRHVELFGSASVGKSTLSLMIAIMAQRLGMGIAYVDCEGSFDPVYARHLGMDTEDLFYHRQKSGEEAVAFMEFLLYAGLHKVIIMDSIASLLPKQEKEATLEAGSMGMEQAKLMSKALRKLTTANDDTLIIFINQLREAIGVTFGKKTTTSGGRAMGFYAGMRMELTKIETLKKKGKKINPKTGEISDADIPYAHRVLAQIAKDKTGGAMVGAEASFVFNYDQQRVDHIEDLIYCGRSLGLVKKSKDKWWVAGYEDEKMHGRPKFVKWLNKNRPDREELESMIGQRIALLSVPDEGED